MANETRDDRYLRCQALLRKRGAHYISKRHRDRQGIMHAAGWWLDGCYLDLDPIRACEVGGVVEERTWDFDVRRRARGRGNGMSGQLVPQDVSADARHGYVDGVRVDVEVEADPAAPECGKDRTTWSASVRQDRAPVLLDLAEWRRAHGEIEPSEANMRALVLAARDEIEAAASEAAEQEASEGFDEPDDDDNHVEDVRERYL